VPKVVVVGAVAMDAVVTVDHQPRPGEELASRDHLIAPGGKALNQAVAAVRAGAEVLLVGCVGHDGFGQYIIDFLARERIGTAHLQLLDDCSTDLALITVDPSGERTIVFCSQCLPRLRFDGLEDTVESGDVLVSQAELPSATIADYFAAARRKGARSILNAAPARSLNVALLRLADVIVLNTDELAAASGRAPFGPGDRECIETAVRGLDTTSEQTVIVTLGADGALVCTTGTTTWLGAPSVKVVDTTGAGDAFVGALAAFLCLAWPMEHAARYACTAASLATTRPGAAPAIPFRAEIEAALPRST
jgi:ribokinase